MTHSSQYKKIFKHLIQQSNIKRLYDIFFEQRIEKIRSSQFDKDEIMKYGDFFHKCVLKNDL